MARPVLERLLDEFRRVHGRDPEAVASAPARLDFLNTHQDYKGLPVVSIGVNLRTYVACVEAGGRRARVQSLNLASAGRESTDEFPIDSPVLRGGRWFGNYIRASIKSLEDMGIRLPGGFSCIINSEVPVAAGLASSAALLVSFIAALNELYGLGLGRRGIAEAAYHAEHDVMGIPCGRLDQYGSAYGGVVKIETRPPYRVEELPRIEGVFIVLDSGIKHSTADIHPRRQAEINEGLRILASMGDLPEHLRGLLAKSYDRVEWEKIPYQEIRPYLSRLPDAPRRRIEFTFRMHESTEAALEIIRGRIPSPERLEAILGGGWRRDVEAALGSPSPQLRLIGVIMNYQHTLLRDLYDVSLPELERIREAALGAGALGVKLSGAGLGGSLIALAPGPSVARRVLDAGLEAGAARGWIVEVDEGVRGEQVP